MVSDLFKVGTSVYGRAGFKLSVSDRGLIITDFLLATSVPYVIQFLVWNSIFADKSADEMILGFSQVQLMVYYAYAIALSRLNNGYDIIEQLSNAVAEGMLEVDVVKPFPYPLQRLFNFVGGGLLYWIPLVLILLYQVLFLAWNLPLIESILFFSTYSLLFIASQVLCFFVSFFLALSAFGFVRAEATLSFITITTAFLGGVLLPPSFWPESLMPLMEYNPFKFMVAAPAEALLNPNIGQTIEYLGMTSAYILIFSIFVGVSWKLLSRRYAGYGG